ncbi:hypothetical protein Hanom_Chr04g00379231 [Helianthus anomalus]
MSLFGIDIGSVSHLFFHSYWPGNGNSSTRSKGKCELVYMKASGLLNVPIVERKKGQFLNVCNLGQLAGKSFQTAHVWCISALLSILDYE